MEPNELKFIILSGGAGSNTNMRSDAHHKSLLPGIPNDITVDLIAPRLPWRTFYVLSRVSRAWLRAIRSHDIYNARVRANSTQTAAVIQYVTSDNHDALALFSTVDNSYYKLPPMEQHDRGWSKFCRYVTVDGKLYGLDGQFVHSMDFAAQNGWKRCGRLLERVAAPFVCGVSHGKIYVFGRTYNGGDHLCELYDPKEDTWSLITPMPYRRQLYLTVTDIGEEFFVHTMQRTHCDGFHENSDVYSPIKDEWRLVKSFAVGGPLVRFFMAQGKLHSICSRGIYAYDEVQNSWDPVHSHSVSAVSGVRIVRSSWNAVQAVGNEIFAIVTLSTPESSLTRESSRTCLVRSNHIIGGGKEGISWQEVRCPYSFLDLPFPECPWASSSFGIYPVQV